jgi:hypothetical protein
MTNKSAFKTGATPVMRCVLKQARWIVSNGSFAQEASH